MLKIPERKHSTAVVYSSAKEDEPGKRKMSRRTFILSLIGGAVAVPAVLGSYARWLEPAWLQDRELTCYLDRLPPSFDGLRIAHISDLHYRNQGGIGEVERLLERVLAKQPDIICLTGDAVDRRLDNRTCESEFVRVLSRFRAPLGQYAVLGNHDYSRGEDLATRLLHEAGFDVLTNTNRVLEARGAKLALAGIDDALDGSPDLNQALAGIPSGTCCVLLAHEPDVADWTLGHEVDIQLSGHSHGGQMRVPFIGPVLLPQLGEKYPDGKYILSRQASDAPLHTPLTLYTSRGSGTSLLPLRFYCPPEWTMITLRVVAV